MRTSPADCVESLREAAETLGKSPTKREYEALGLSPSSGTIVRLMDSWNDAKETAGLETWEPGELGGYDIQPKPDHVDLPEGMEWEELTANQRYYYKNPQYDIDRRERRRKELRAWLHDYKEKECTCRRCGESNPACLDFHHLDDKEMGISMMVTNGRSPDSILEEIEKCEVLCANCHRVEHYTVPEMAE